MRHYNIGGIMLSSLDMDDFSGMFCTGDNYPLLNTIHNQLLAPLPKNSRLHKNNRPQNKRTGVTKKPNILTTESMNTLPTTYYIFDTTFFETTTTTELTTTTVKPFRRMGGSKRPVKQVGNIIIADRRNFDTAQQKAKSHQTDAQGNTKTNKYFETLTPLNNLKPESTVQSEVPSTNRQQNSQSKEILEKSSSLSDMSTEYQVQKTTKQTTTPTVQVTSPNKETELRNFLKQAADLPSHSLINGIMKLLEQADQSKASGGNEIIATLSPSKHTTSTNAPEVTTTTEPPIRLHKNEPDMRIVDLRSSAPSNINSDGLFKQDIRKVNQPFIDISKDILTGQKKRDRLTNFPLNENELFAAVKQSGNDRIDMTPLQNIEPIETPKQKQLVPAPFPLPDRKETRPSKSFLDMKDLGFLP